MATVPRESTLPREGKVHSPIVRRRRLGAALRELRDTAGLTHVQVAEAMDCSQGKISKIETGRVPVRTLEVKAMAELYGATPERIAVLLGLAKESKQKGWWHVFGPTLTPGFETYLGFEAEASALRVFSSGSLPGLLQTKEYASALLGALATVEPLDVDSGVAMRMARQERLSGDSPVEFRAVIDEAALRRLVGGAEVMRQQLRHLVHLSYRSNVTLQVLPNSVGAHPLLGDNLVLIEFGDPTDSPVAYLENSASSVCLDKPADQARYQVAMDRLAAAALSPKDSVAMIARIADELG